MTIFGLPEAAVQESLELVDSAIKNAGLYFPRKRLTVNLALAAVRKEGPAYDLPIALGVLIASDQLPPECLEGGMVVGELSLDGSVRQYCHLDDTSRSLMRTAMSQMQLSARAYHRVLKLSRTISDLAGEEVINPTQLAEALQYRPKMQMF